MPAYVEQIVAAVTTIVGSLTTTGSNVVRGRVYPVESDVSNALSVFQGTVDPNGGRSNVAFYDPDLVIIVRAHVKSASVQIDTQLNLIFNEVFAAMAADRKLGLPSIVIDSDWVGNNEPVLSGDGNIPTALMDMKYLVRFRHSTTNASA